MPGRADRRVQAVTAPSPRTTRSLLRNARPPSASTSATARSAVPGLTRARPSTSRGHQPRAHVPGSAASRSTSRHRPHTQPAPESVGPESTYEVDGPRKRHAPAPTPRIAGYRDRSAHRALAVVRLLGTRRARHLHRSGSRRRDGWLSLRGIAAPCCTCAGEYRLETAETSAIRVS